jgi:hypothetical protein
VPINTDPIGTPSRGNGASPGTKTLRWCDHVAPRFADLGGKPSAVGPVLTAGLGVLFAELLAVWLIRRSRSRARAAAAA